MGRRLWQKSMKCNICKCDSYIYICEATFINVTTHLCMWSHICICNLTFIYVTAHLYIWPHIYIYDSTFMYVTSHLYMWQHIYICDSTFINKCDSVFHKCHPHIYECDSTFINVESPLYTVLTRYYAPFVYKPPLPFCAHLLRRYIYLQFKPPPDRTWRV